MQYPICLPLWGFWGLDLGSWLVIRQGGQDSEYRLNMKRGSKKTGSIHHVLLLPRTRQQTGWVCPGLSLFNFPRLPKRSKGKNCRNRSCTVWTPKLAA